MVLGCVSVYKHGCGFEYVRIKSSQMCDTVHMWSLVCHYERHRGNIKKPPLFNTENSKIKRRVSLASGLKTTTIFNFEEF